MNAAEAFSPDYQTARAAFLAAAREVGAELSDHAHPETGRQGEALFTDVAWIGPRNASQVLVMISGTHGVEGFCGSGAQINWLRRGEAEGLGPDQAALLIHAINPYGFSWLRRVTHENVDLNRNWIDFDRPAPLNSGYDELAEAMVPQEWTSEAQARAFAVLGEWMAGRGMTAFQQAASGGQYRHPTGIFYGGSSPTWSRRTQTRIFQEQLGSAARVAIIDFHTGLGPWGLGERILGEAPGTAGFARAKAWYGEAATSAVGGTSTSAVITGDGLDAAPGLLPKAEVTGMALEFGTVPVLEVLQALRADAWLHAHGDPSGPESVAIKRGVRDAFYVDRDDWKGMIAGQALLAARQALAGLNS